MTGKDEHIAEQRFEQFLSLCFAGMHHEESNSCIQFLLDQLTIFLSAQRSYIIHKTDRLRILFESSELNRYYEITVFKICETAIEKCLIQNPGAIIENNSTCGVDENVSTSVLCVPILVDNSADTVIQLVRIGDTGQFCNAEMELVSKIARLVAPVIQKEAENLKINKFPGLFSLEKRLREKYNFSAVIGHNNKIIELLDLVTKVMDVDVPVLIEGESGTGKELIARAIHYNGKRKKSPMICVNCGAIPENLLESEFFGHEKGAFTSATTKKIGQFEAANNGTIFLDEIGSLNLAMQVKLLRALQWNEFTPVGGILPKKVNVRVLAASNQNLSELVEKNRFRADLYYRLNVLRLSLPPLRERKDDIPILCYHLIELNCEKLGRTKLKILPDAMDMMMSYDFPGNVRELENIIQRAIIICEGNEINHNHLPFEVKKNGKAAQGVYKKDETFKTAKQKVVQEFEREFLIKKLVENRGIVLRAAKKAGMYEANFRAKMKQYDINVDDINYQTRLYH